MNEARLMLVMDNSLWAFFTLDARTPALLRYLMGKPLDGMIWKHRGEGSPAAG